MRAMFVAFMALSLSGCSAFSSRAVQVNEEKRVPGLVYFLPKADVLAKVTIEGKKFKSVTIGTTEHYPDIEQAYLLTHNQGPLATHVSDITVQNGLLTTVKGTNTSAMPAIAQALAASVAATTGKPSKSLNECTDGEHSITFAVDADIANNPPTLCGVTFAIEPLFAPARTQVAAGGNQEDRLPQYGVYYRVMLPYRVTATATGVERSAIVLSPTRSPAFLLPTAAGLFSSPSAEIALDAGVPTSYKQTTDSEVASALKFPADVIGAYFTAVGNLLTGLKNNTTSELEYRKQILQLEIYRQKQAACLDAIKRGAQDEIETLGCKNP